jgi:hypothetical protein
MSAENLSLKNSGKWHFGFRRALFGEKWLPEFKEFVFVYVPSGNKSLQPSPSPVGLQYVR